MPVISSKNARARASNRLMSVVSVRLCSMTLGRLDELAKLRAKNRGPYGNGANRSALIVEALDAWLLNAITAEQKRGGS